MALVYFDSSAFVKLLVQEPGSEFAEQLWEGCDAALSSRIAYPEVCASLSSSQRGGRITRQQHAQAIEYWEQMWAAVRVIEVSASLAAQAGQLTQRFVLRGADAIHLASVELLGSEHTLFAVWDQRLRAGAESVGVPVVPVK